MDENFIYRWVFASLTLLLALVASRTVRADELLVERLDPIVAQQQKELVAFQTVGYRAGSDDCSCGQCVKCCRDNRSCRGGLYAAVDLTFLRPYMSGDGLSALIPSPGPGGLESAYPLSPRVIVGYEGANGFGIRTRYWFFDHSFALDGIAPTFGIDMDVLDVEATLFEESGSWDLQFAGGVRYGRQEWSFNGLQARYEGVGLTVATEVMRPIYDSNWSLLGNCRGSLLYGDIRDTGLILGSGTFTTEEETMQIWEMQLGVEYARKMSSGEVAIQFLWETQHWENAWLASWLTDLGFAGPTLKVEFRR